jgi:hypothetical protein
VKAFHDHGIEGLMAILSKWVYAFSAIPIKVIAAFSAENATQILKFIYEYKGPRVAKNILKKNKVELGVMVHFYNTSYLGG